MDREGGSRLLLNAHRVGAPRLPLGPQHAPDLLIHPPPLHDEVGSLHALQDYRFAGVLAGWVDVSQKSLGQDEGLAAAGACGERDAAVSRLQGQAALVGERRIARACGAYR